MSILIENMQKIFEVNKQIEKLICDTVSACFKFEKFGIESEINILLVDNEKIKQINNEQRNINSVTDVLSFPMVEMSEGKIISNEGDFNLDENLLILGDIVLSLEKVKEQSENYGHSFERELAFLVSHGVFHLLGYDHADDDQEIIMMSRQESVLASMGLKR